MNHIRFVIIKLMKCVRLFVSSYGSLMVKGNCKGELQWSMIFERSVVNSKHEQKVK